MLAIRIDLEKQRLLTCPLDQVLSIRGAINALNGVMQEIAQMKDDSEVEFEYDTGG